MVRPTKRQRPQPIAVGGGRTRLIGFIGRAQITEREGTILTLIGRSLARLGHTLVTVPAKGATAKVREGVELEEGSLLDLQTGVLDQADHTLLYADPQLIQRLREKYPELDTRYRVTILQTNQLELFWSAMITIMGEQGIEVPT